MRGRRPRTMPRPVRQWPSTRRRVELSRYRPWREHRRRWPLRTAAGLCVLLLVAIIASIVFVGYARWRFDDVDKPAVAGLAPRHPGQPFDLVLLASEAVPGHAAPAGDSAGAEVLAIARVVPTTRQATLLAIPTTTTVELPATPRRPATVRTLAALAAQGPTALVAALEGSFGLPINDFVALDLNLLPGLADAAGGLPLDLAYPIHDATTGTSIAATGCVTVAGSEALALLRSRNLLYYDAHGGGWLSDETGEGGALMRADGVLAALVARVGGATGSPLTLAKVLRTLPHALSFDPSLTESATYELGRDLAGGPIATALLPTAPATIGGHATRIPAVSADEQALRAFLSFGGTAPQTVTVSAPPARGVGRAGGAPAAPFNPTPCS